MDADDTTTVLLAHERRVWDALVAGDRTADEALLAADFLGVYPTGFAGRTEHVAQFAAEPTVESYEIRSPRSVVITDDHVLLAYEALFTRPRGTAERMYVSSLWSRRGNRWVNTFSQDTPAASDAS